MEKKQLTQRLQKRLHDLRELSLLDAKRSFLSLFRRTKPSRFKRPKRKKAVSHRSRYELAYLADLKEAWQEILTWESLVTLGAIWNRSLLHHIMPRGWALLGGVGHVTSLYGPRRNPIGEGIEFHAGVDFAYAKGTPIIATAPGVVLRAVNTPKSGYGNFVQLHHGLGYTSLYAHCQSILVKEGDYIERGQIIGRLGNTGRATGDHLHYEIQLGYSKASNPLPYVKLE